MEFSPQKTLELVEPAVENAGTLIRESWKQPKSLGYKGRADLVTETDWAVERELQKSLGSILPQAEFLAEESAIEQELGAISWIVDPLDGTTNFAHSLPIVAVSVALWAEGTVQLGVIHLPLLGETFTASKGGGSRLNGELIRVSSNQGIEESLIATGFPYNIDERAETELERLRSVLLRARGVRRMGAAAVDLAYTACGRFEAFYEVGLKPWDTAAGWLLVREAGGRVSTFHGEEPFIPGAWSILASNGHIHQSLSELL